LIHADAKKRANVMKHFVMTAEHCRSINNFSTMAAIMAGLNSTPIRRLQRTRSLLSAKTMAAFDDLDKTLDSGKNFAGYRERLKRVDPPCIPFLGTSPAISQSAY
jgi:son of sevenless-like protein